MKNRLLYALAGIVVILTIGSEICFADDLKFSLDVSGTRSCNLASKNPKELKEYCRDLKKQYPHKKEIIVSTYIRTNGYELKLVITDCDNVPEQSIRVDDVHYLLCYFDEVMSK